MKARTNITRPKFEDLLGKTLISVKNHDNEEIVFETSDGDFYSLYHSQSCCESVTVEDIIGDLDDLLGSPLTMAEEVSHEGTNPEGVTVPEYQDSFTWTFYKLATVRGYVTIRWYGESNGYYSESVSFDKIRTTPREHEPEPTQPREREPEPVKTPDEEQFTLVGEDGKEWPLTMDAVAWAKAYVKTVTEIPAIATDEGTMIGWFANAIMAGYDEAERRFKPSDSSITQ